MLPRRHLCGYRGLPAVKHIAISDLERAAVRRPAGYLEDVRSRATEITGTHVVLEDDAYADLYAKYSPGYLDPGLGPGTELKKLLAMAGIKAEVDCPCNKHARIMNIWGPDECERRIDEIVGWLQEEAARRNLPFLNVAGRVLVHRAIANARRLQDR